jgi:hypothetical protein
MYLLNIWKPISFVVGCLGGEARDVIKIKLEYYNRRKIWLKKGNAKVVI